MTLFIGCPYICSNKNSLGFCKTTTCINPLYNGCETYTVTSDHTECIYPVVTGTGKSKEMIFENTDILCVAAGLGATYAADKFPARYREAASVDEALKLVAAHECRYVLLNADKDTRDTLDAREIDYVVIAPDPYRDSEWVERWLKTGSSAKTIKARLARREEKQNVDGCLAPIAYVPSSKWLGEMLEQTKADPTDRKDV